MKTMMLQNKAWQLKIFLELFFVTFEMQIPENIQSMTKNVIYVLREIVCP